jgi:hypothetical protein
MCTYPVVKLALLWCRVTFPVSYHCARRSHTFFAYCSVPPPWEHIHFTRLGGLFLSPFVIMRTILLPLFYTLIANVSGQLQFLNPAPFGKRGDFSNSETYTQGSTVNVAWTGSEPGKGVSLVLYQLDDTGKWFGDMEYLTRKETDYIIEIISVANTA